MSVSAITAIMEYARWKKMMSLNVNLTKTATQDSFAIKTYVFLNKISDFHVKMTFIAKIQPVA